MEEQKEIDEEVVAAEAEDELLDYDEGLVTTIANLAECKSFIRKHIKQHPVLKESLFEEFILKIREERYTSKLSNIADQLAYRSINTIKTEGTALVFWFVNISPKLDVILGTDTLELIRVLTEAKGKKKNSKAAAGTCLARLKALLFCIDLFPRFTGLKGQARLEKVNALKTNAEAFTVMAEDSQKAKRDAKDLPRSFEEVVEKVKAKFGQNSAQYILFALYSQLPVRDNLNLEIVHEAHIDNQSKSNLLVLKPTGPLRVVILDHKTRNLYGDLGQLLSLHLSNVIRNFILTKNLKLHDHLFGEKKKLSSFVQQIFTEVGYPGLSINAIREIYENTNASLPALERAKLARLAGHSLQTARANYVMVHAQQQVAAVQEEVLDQTVANQDRILELNQKIDSLTDSINQIKDKLKI